MIPRFCFLKKTFQKGLSIILSIPLFGDLGRCVHLNVVTGTASVLLKNIGKNRLTTFFNVFKYM